MKWNVNNAYSMFMSQSVDADKIASLDFPEELIKFLDGNFPDITALQLLKLKKLLVVSYMVSTNLEQPNKFAGDYNWYNVEKKFYYSCISFEDMFDFLVECNAPCMKILIIT